MSTEQTVRLWVRDVDMACPVPFDIKGAKINRVPGWLQNPQLFHDMLKREHGINTFGPVLQVIEGGLGQIQDDPMIA